MTCDCKHCSKPFTHSPSWIGGGGDKNGAWYFVNAPCPGCGLSNLYGFQTKTGNVPPIVNADQEAVMKWPMRILTERPCPPDVPDPYRQDFIEASKVLAISPQASAALSRRTLQAVLKDKGNFTERDLAPQIESAIKSNSLPSYVSDMLHYVREVGNWAAHPKTFIATGEIVPVTPEEAEASLNAVESVLDFYFVQPAKAQKILADMAAKKATIQR